MSNKILILPNFAEQVLPNEGLDRYDKVLLLTEDQDNLPFKVVKNLMNLAKTQQVDIDFLEIPHQTENELLLDLAFKIAILASADPEVQITFVTENRNFDTLVEAAKANGLSVARADGFSRISAVPSGPSKIQNPLKPHEVTVNKPAAKVQEVVQQARPAAAAAAAALAAAKKEPAQSAGEAHGDKNKKLIASLLSGQK